MASFERAGGNGPSGLGSGSCNLKVAPAFDQRSEGSGTGVEVTQESVDWKTEKWIPIYTGGD